MPRGIFNSFQQITHKHGIFPNFKVLFSAMLTDFCSLVPGADLGGGCRGFAPPSPPEMTCGFLIQLVFCKKKKICGLLVLKQSKRRVYLLLKKILDPSLIPVRLIRCLTTPCCTSLCISFSLPSPHCSVGLTLKGNYTSFETVPRATITIGMTLNVRQFQIVWSRIWGHSNYRPSLFPCLLFWWRIGRQH